MSAWTERISVKRASSTLRSALSRGLIGDETRAVVFHDLGRMRARLDEIASRFPRSALHTVAIKANPLVEVLRAIADRGVGLEAASHEEVELALAAGCPPERVIFDSPAKTRQELSHALSRGVRINADNLVELSRIAEIRRNVASESVVGLRVNPLVGQGTIALTSVAMRSSKFGVPIDMDRDDLVAVFERYPWLTGLHVHAGSQGCSLSMMTTAVTTVASLLFDLNRRLERAQITTLDIGGGLPAIYRDSDHPPTLADYVTALRAAAPAIFEAPIELVTEFGRAVQAPSGWAASRVEYVKSAGDEQLAVIHLGADMLLRWVYQPGHWRHEVAVLDADGQEKRGSGTPWTIVGPLCFGGDVLARGVMLPAIEPGDYVILRDVGAYTMSMWSRHCSRGLPLVLGQDGDELRVLKEAETAEDVVAFWSRGGRASGG